MIAALLTGQSMVTSMRPNPDEYFMAMACLCATRGTCTRRRVGCVLVDKDNKVLATGYNGKPMGFDHCTEDPLDCPGAFAKSGTNLVGCGAIHAEANALLQCNDRAAIHTVYCTTAPCWECTKLFLNTGAQRIVYLEHYAQANQAGELWRKRMPFNSWSKFVPAKIDDPLSVIYTVHKTYQALTRG